MVAMYFDSKRNELKLMNAMYYMGSTGCNFAQWGNQFVTDTLDKFFRLKSSQPIARETIRDRVTELFKDPLPSSNERAFLRDDKKKRTTSKSQTGVIGRIDREIAAIALLAKNVQAEVFNWASEQRTLARVLRKVGMKSLQKGNEIVSQLSNNNGVLFSKVKDRYFNFKGLG